MSHSSIGLPVDGAGKRLQTHVNDLGNHHQQITITDPIVSDNMQRVDEYGAAYTRGADGSTIFDSFGKTKVSEELILGQYVAEYDEMPERFSVNITGTAQQIYVPDEKSCRLQVDNLSGDRIVKTSHKYHKYTPGTSHSILMTTVPNSPVAGVTKNWGYYDDNDGVFFQQTGDGGGVVVRSSITGTPVDTVIPQASFNVDKLDGTGISGITMDHTKANIFFIDIQWLGVGRVRFGMVSPEGNRIVMHVVENANAHNSVYMKTASLPIRHEIFNTAGTGGASELKVLNSVVFTESSNLRFDGGCQSTMNNPNVPTDITEAFTHIMTFKPKLSFKGKENRIASIPINLSAISTQVTHIQILKNAVLDGNETYTDVDTTYSPMQVSRDGVYVSGGHKVFCTIVGAGLNKMNLKDDFSYLNENLIIHGDASDADTYTIVARTITGITAGTLIAGMRWTELIV